MKPGLYNENNEIIKTWDELVDLGLMDIEYDWNHEEATYDHDEDYYEHMDSAKSICAILEDYNLSGKIVLPDTVKKIGDYAFAHSNITEIVIPDSVDSIGRYAFWHCYKLKKVTFPEYLNVIKSGAFDRCTNLEIDSLPEGITKLEPYTFSVCERIERMKLPETLRHIDEGAFYACDKLRKLVIPEKVAWIDPYILDSSEWPDINSDTDIQIVMGKLAYDNSKDFVERHEKFIICKDYNTLLNSELPLTQVNQILNDCER